MKRTEQDKSLNRDERCYHATLSHLGQLTSCSAQCCTGIAA